MGAFEAYRMVHRRSAARLARVAVPAIVITLATAAWVVFLPTRALGPGWFFVLVIFGLFPFIEGVGIKTDRAHVIASHDGVFVDGRRVLSPGSFVEAAYEPAMPTGAPARSKGGLVRFMGARRKTLLAVVVRDEDEAHRLLEAAEADVAKRSAFTAPSAIIVGVPSRTRVLIAALLPSLLMFPVMFGSPDTCSSPQSRPSQSFLVSSVPVAASAWAAMR